MSEEHLSRDLVQRFFRSELSASDNRAVLHHLIRHCDECLAVVIEVGAEEGYIYQDGDFRSALFPEGAERYHEAFLRALGSIDDAHMDLARERLRGIGLWHALEKHDQGRRLEMIQEDPRMHTWGLYDRLLEKSREMGFRAPGYAAEIADLALAVVDTLNQESYGATRIADLRAGAWGVLANARRRASDFAGAEKALRQAQDELDRGAGAPAEQAHLLSLQASLHKDLGDFERAVEILDRVIALYQDLQDPHLQGRTLLKQADTIVELTLLSIDLAEVYVAREKHEEALELIEEFGPMLREWGMHTEGLAMWLLLQKAVLERRARSEAFRQMAEYLNRAWFRPLGPDLQ